jgi:hypothetical protein
MTGTMITKQQLAEIVSNLAARDFFKFAEAVIAIDPVVGATVQMHAESADGNSPDLRDWVQYTLDDANNCDESTIEAAQQWWRNCYASK